MSYDHLNISRQFFDNDGHPVSGGMIYFYQAGTSNAVSTYKDKELENVNTSPIILDAAGRLEFPVFMPKASKFKIDVRNQNNVSLAGYPLDWQSSGTTFADEWGSFTPVANQDMDGTKLTNVGPAVLSHELPTVRQIQENYGRYYETGGIGNVFLMTATPAIETYLSGLSFIFKADHSNDGGAATLNINALGTQPLIRFDGSDLRNGDIVSGQIYETVYNGTSFVLLNPSTLADAVGEDVSFVTQVTSGLATFEGNIQLEGAHPKEIFFENNAPTDEKYFAWESDGGHHFLKAYDDNLQNPVDFIQVERTGRAFDHVDFHTDSLRIIPRGNAENGQGWADAILDADAGSSSTVYLRENGANRGLVKANSGSDRLEMIKYNASGISQNLMYLYADHTYFADETRHSSGLETDEIREYSNSGNNVSFPDAIRVDDLYELTSGHGIYTDGVHSKDGNIQLGDNGVLSSVGSLYFDIDIDNNSGTRSWVFRDNGTTPRFQVTDDGYAVIKREAGSTCLSLIDEGATSANNANPVMDFRYTNVPGGSTTRLGYVGCGAGSNDDLYLLSDTGHIRYNVPAGHYHIFDEKVDTPEVDADTGNITTVNVNNLNLSGISIGKKIAWNPTDVEQVYEAYYVDHGTSVTICGKVRMNGGDTISNLPFAPEVYSKGWAYNTFGGVGELECKVLEGSISLVLSASAAPDGDTIHFQINFIKN